VVDRPDSSNRNSADAVESHLERDVVMKGHVHVLVRGVENMYMTFNDYVTLPLAIKSSALSGAALTTILCCFVMTEQKWTQTQ